MDGNQEQFAQQLAADMAQAAAAAHQQFLFQLQPQLMMEIPAAVHQDAFPVPISPPNQLMPSPQPPQSVIMALPAAADAQFVPHSENILLPSPFQHQEIMAAPAVDNALDTEDPFEFFHRIAQLPIQTQLELGCFLPANLQRHQQILEVDGLLVAAEVVGTIDGADVEVVGTIDEAAAEVFHFPAHVPVQNRLGLVDVALVQYLRVTEHPENMQVPPEDQQPDAAPPGRVYADARELAEDIISTLGLETAHDLAMWLLRGLQQRAGIEQEIVNGNTGNEAMEQVLPQEAAAEPLYIDIPAAEPQDALPRQDGWADYGLLMFDPATLADDLVRFRGLAAAHTYIAEMQMALFEHLPVPREPIDERMRAAFEQLNRLQQRRLQQIAERQAREEQIRNHDELVNIVIRQREHDEALRQQNILALNLMVEEIVRRERLIRNQPQIPHEEHQEMAEA